jgi:hypothetical protein
MHHMGRDLVGVSLGEIEADFHRLRRRVPAGRHEVPAASLMMPQPMSADRMAVTWFGDCSGVLRAPDGSSQVLGDAVSHRRKEVSHASEAAAQSAGGPAGRCPAGARATALLPSLPTGESHHWPIRWLALSTCSFSCRGLNSRPDLVKLYKRPVLRLQTPARPRRLICGCL